MYTTNSSTEIAASKWTIPAGIAELAKGLSAGLIADLVEEFQEDAFDRLERLQRALHAADRVRLRREAHSLKGAAIQMGVPDMAALCKLIEGTAEESSLLALAGDLARLEASFTATAALMRDYAQSIRELAPSASAPS